MVQKNKIIAILALTLALVFAGCTSSADAETQQNNFFDFGSSGSSSNAVSSSSGGVDLSFAEGNPPREMFKGQDYSFSFVFRNDQRHTIDDMTVRTRGYDTGFVTGLASSYDVGTIPRANELSGPGVYASLIVDGVRADGFSGDYDFSPRFDYCYTAVTTFREQVCVPSLRNQCDLQYDRATTQNGPVRVDLGELQVTGDEVILPIRFSDRGSGATVNTCFDDNVAYQTAFNNLVVQLGSQTGECRAASSDSLAFIDGEATLFCEFDRTGADDQAYISQLSISYDYLYEQSTDLDIIVRDLGEFLN